MEFGQKKFFREIDLFDFTSFFAWTFLNFLAHCVCDGSRVPETRFFKTRPSFEFTIFDKNPFFAISKMAKNQFLNWEKV